MKKFEIKTDTFEYRYDGVLPSQSAEEILAIYQSQSSTDPALEASFDTIEEARAEFQRSYASYGLTRKERSFHGFNLLRGQIAWIEENDYDEDGEFDQGGSVWDFAAQPYDGEADY